MFSISLRSSIKSGFHHYLSAGRRAQSLLKPFFCFWILCAISWPGKAQEAKPAGAPSDHSGEAYVVEQSVNGWTFENDGSGSREETVRVRIQSDAGIQQFGLLVFSYQKAVENAEIDYVRVRKPDGSIVSTPTDEVQDMAAAVTREAPFYSDLREKHLAVKGLSPGDVLEYRCHWNVIKSLIPGQFWMSFTFPHDYIILEQKVEVRVPHERVVKFKSAGLAPAISDDGKHRVYAWSRSNLEIRRRPKAELADLYVHGGFPAPDIQLSTFQSWDEVGRWYGGLQQDRVIPSPEIRAKAAELTRNAADDQAKIQAIYKYVSTEYRYIGVDFGIGRYQPHLAAEVLENQYGDCKDKHTLLASLLAAAGISAYPALINSTHVIDPDVPTPAQFDHVITAAPRGKEFLWLDTTTEVGPLGYLVTMLRGKQALVIPPDKPSVFQTTPANPPLPTLWTFKINAKLDESGTLEGKVEQTLRGDLEVIWRSSLRRLPRTQWKDAIQRFSYATGFAGEVSDVAASTPEATETPLHFSYTYRRKQYPDWENHRISPPAPLVFAPPFEEDGKLPQQFWLGAPGKFEFESKVELPKGYSPDIPPNKDLKEDFAEYHSTYAFQDGTLIAHYQIVVKIPEVSGPQVNDYKTMAEKAMKDRIQFIPLSSMQVESSALYLGMLVRQSLEMPDSADTKALQFEQDAKAAIGRRSVPEALDAFQKALAQDPRFTRAWILMGQVYLFSAQPNAGINALRRAVEVDPKQALPHKILALALGSLGRRNEAIQAWQDLAKITPDDKDLARTIGGLMLAEKRFAEAVPYLEQATKLYPDDTAGQIALATAYLNSGQDDKAGAGFDKAIQLRPEAGTQNDIAYALASANKRLEDALRYAQEAVRREEEASSKVQLSKLVVDDLKHTLALGDYWDTLGWVYYRQGDLKHSEEYLYAAWTLRQSPTIGYHLAQVYEKQQRQSEAVRMCRFVASVGQFGLGAEDLDAIAQAKKQLEGRPEPPAHRVGGRLLADNPAGEMSQERSTTVPKLAAKEANAEFFLSFVPESRARVTASGTQEAMAEDSKFVSGSDLLRTAGQALREAHFKVVFPEGSSGRLVRRGILACYPLTGCTFVLIPVESVRRVD